ncbi:hypothetical protein FA13DRAFT_1638642, partial [Coprinellus micaceus]
QAMADEVYSKLPPRTQERIDDAFRALFEQSRGLAHSGGFVRDSESNNPQTQIPLDLVPSALGRLNLPDDDDAVFTVFRNAASGWKGGSYSEDVAMGGEGEYELGVSLEDWRSVCAVLLEDDDEGDGFVREDDDNSGEDVYRGEDESADGEGSDDDFIPGPRTRRTRGSTRNISPDSTATPPRGRAKPRAKDTDVTKLTAKQKQAAFDTFALFFPDVKEEELKGERIMIKDVQRVAGLLKEKIKAEEVIDMLEMFSTSLDKSMSYDDFVRMLAVTGMI